VPAPRPSRLIKLALLCAACSSCGGDGGAAGADGGVSSSPDAPRILSLETNTKVLHETDSLVITAVVTDPDGIDDLIGGTLLDPDTGASYGAFATSAAEGAYSIQLDWGTIDVVRGIDAPATGAPRAFRARFFDVAGHTADGDVEVTTKCEDDDLAACSGDCVDLMTSREHCGACDSPVPDGAECEDGQPGCVDGFEDTVAACTDGCSNDGDSYIDCDDFDCCDVVDCPATSACG
jgi:hypothetical protein